MRNKFIAQFLTVLMVLSIFGTVGVSADALPNLSDNAELAKPANLITSNLVMSDFEKTWDQLNLINSSGVGDLGTNKICVHYTSDPTDGILTEGETPSRGVKFGAEAKEELSSVLQNGKKIVVSLTVWNRSVDDPYLRMLIGAYQPTENGYFYVLPKEYSTYPSGVAVTGNHTAKTDIAMTLKMPDTGVVSGAPNITIGWAETVGTKNVQHNFGFDTTTLYIAEEAANKLEVTATGTSLYQGVGSIKLTAKVLNQVGVEGYIDQGVTWYAVDTATRTQVIPGINVAPDGTVTASADVPMGSYDIVAVSQANNTLVKGITINVKSLAVDNDTLQKPANLITDTLLDNAFEVTPILGFNTHSVNGDDEIGAAYLGKVGDGSLTGTEFPSWGFRPTAATKTSYLSSILQNGKKFVVGLDVKSMNENPLKILIGAYQPTGATFQKLPYEYPDYPDGKSVGTTYTNVSATLKMPDSGVTTSTHITIGFPEDEASVEANASEKNFLADLSSLYIAEEAPTKLMLSTDKTTCIAGDSAFGIEATVLNQIGSEGYVSQDVDWYVMNEDKSEIVSDITIEKINDGIDGKAKVIVPITVPAGNYNIVAASKADSRLLKSIPITVERAIYLADLELTEFSGNSVTATATLTDCQAEDGTSYNAVMVVVMVDEKTKEGSSVKYDEIVKIIAVPVVDSYDDSETTKSVTLTGTDDVDRAYALLWEASGEPQEPTGTELEKLATSYANINMATLKELAQKAVVSK